MCKNTTMVTKMKEGEMKFLIDFLMIIEEKDHNWYLMGQNGLWDELREINSTRTDIPAMGAM